MHTPRLRAHTQKSHDSSCLRALHCCTRQLPLVNTTHADVHYQFLVWLQPCRSNNKYIENREPDFGWPVSRYISGSDKKISRLCDRLGTAKSCLASTPLCRFRLLLVCFYRQSASIALPGPIRALQLHPCPPKARYLTSSNVHTPRISLIWPSELFRA